MIISLSLIQTQDGETPKQLMIYHELMIGPVLDHHVHSIPPLVEVTDLSTNKQHTLSTPLYRTSGGWLSFGCSVVSRRPLRSRAVAGCLSASASAWGPFWPPVPRPRLRPPGGGVGFPLRGGVWAE